MPPFIVTLKLDPATFARLGTLRRAHFPAHLNLIPAHVSLFHKLEGEVERPLRLAARRTAIRLSFTGYRLMGRGVCLKVESPELMTLRRDLAATFADQLTPQDRQGYGPHVTIQNKVTPEEARRLRDRLAEDFTPFDGVGEGLLLWRYLGGPWELTAECPFEA
jgi:2'-5' RNA ligase